MARVKEGGHGPCTAYTLCENRTKKRFEIVLSRREGMRDNDGGGEPHPGTL
jgi:hypothetical protein